MSDLIRRQAAIDSLYPIRCNLQMMDDTYTADKVMHGLWLAENAIKQLPSAEPRWIPVRERLPRCFEPVLTCVDGRIYVDVRERTGWRFRVTEYDAWMPLPQPWKGADDE